MRTARDFLVTKKESTATFPISRGAWVLLWASLAMACSIDRPSLYPSVPFRLPMGARLLVVESKAGPGGLAVRPFRRSLDLDGWVLVAPPQVFKTVFRVDSLAVELAQGVAAEMIFIVSPESITESAYNPAPVPGEMVATQIRAGGVGGPSESVPVLTPTWEIAYGNRCRRVAYRIRVYDGQGRPKGETRVCSSAFQPCPPTAPKDILYDDAEYVVAWFKTNLRTESKAGPPAGLDRCPPIH